MNYELIETDEGATLKRTDADGKVWWIPTDPNNSDYAQYLALQAWVASGKKEQDFWTQSFE